MTNLILLSFYTTLNNTTRPLWKMCSLFAGVFLVIMGVPFSDVSLFT